MTNFNSVEEREEKALALDVRKNIYELVRKFAGCHFRELERKSGLATGTIRYHLTYLVKQGLLSEVKESNSVRYFPKLFRSENKKLLALLRQQSIRRILVCILEKPGCNHEDIVAFVKLSPSTVSWHVKKLSGEGIITATKQGRKTLFKLLVPKEDVMKLLITHKESFLDSMVDKVIEMWEG